MVRMTVIRLALVWFSAAGVARTSLAATTIEVNVDGSFVPLDKAVVATATPEIRIVRDVDVPSNFSVLLTREDGRAGFGGAGQPLYGQTSAGSGTLLQEVGPNTYQGVVPALVGVNSIHIQPSGGGADFVAAAMLNYSRGYEDINGNGQLDFDEDANGDGVLSSGEDANLNVLLDFNEDTNGNGVLDTGEDFDQDGLLDPDEDLNGNGVLDAARSLPVNALVSPTLVTGADGEPQKADSVLVEFLAGTSDAQLSAFFESMPTLRPLSLRPVGILVDEIIGARVLTARILDGTPPDEAAAILNGLPPGDTTIPPPTPPPPPVRFATPNFVSEFSLIAGEAMPQRLRAGAAPNGGDAYNANRGGFDDDGDVCGPGLGGPCDETEVALQHWFCQTFAAHRLLAMLPTAAAPQHVAVIDSGFGNGAADLPDIPQARFINPRNEVVRPMGWNGPGSMAIAAGNPATIAGIPEWIPTGPMTTFVHGTHTASLAAGNGTTLVLGMGNRVGVRPVRIDGSAADINAALTTLGGDGNVSVVSMSLKFCAPAASAAAGMTRVRARRTAIRAGLAAVNARNPVLVVCAGNEAESTERAYPALFSVPAQNGLPIDDDGVGGADLSPNAAGMNVPNVINDPVENPLAIAVGAVGVVNGPRGPEQFAAFSNFGPRQSMTGIGAGVIGVDPFPMGGGFALAGPISGCSFATPQIAGAIAELINTARALPAGLFSGGNPAVTVAQQRQRVMEIVLATADDLGTTAAAPPGAAVSNNAGDGPDQRFGIGGRLNYWKAALSVANQGLAAQHGRDLLTLNPPMMVADNRDDRFPQLPTIADANTLWYGFEIRTSELGATVWLDGVQLADNNTAGPDGVAGNADDIPSTTGPDGVAGNADDLMPNAPNITAFRGTRSELRIERGVHTPGDVAPTPFAATALTDAAPVAGAAPGQVVEEDPLAEIVPVGTAVNNRGQYAMHFSIQRSDLYGALPNGMPDVTKPKTLTVRRRGVTSGQVAAGAAVAKPLFNLRLDTVLMRSGNVSGVVFDDFVFTITPADFGDAAIAPTLLRAGGATPENGARHLNSNLEWLGKLDPPADVNGNPNLKGVSPEHNADFEANTGDARVDIDGVTNRKGFHDRDGRDDGVVFFPLTFKPDAANPNATPGKVRFTVRVHDRTSARYVVSVPPDPAGTNAADKSLFFNLWIDWNSNGVWEEPTTVPMSNGNNEHVLSVRIDPSTWTAVDAAATGAMTMPTADVAADNNARTFQSMIRVGNIRCGPIWARARLDYGENVGQNDPRPVFRSLPSLRGLAVAMGSPQPPPTAAMPVGYVYGAARYGEVEDYFLGSDFGDAPDNGSGMYPTLKAQMGPRHLDIHQEWLGLANPMRPSASREVDAKPDFNLSCLFFPLNLAQLFAPPGTDEDLIDNLRFSGDNDKFDDGVMIPAFPKVCGPGTTIPIKVTMATSVAERGSVGNAGPAVGAVEDEADSLPRYSSADPKRRLYLSGWADWNGNGLFETPAEKIVDQPVDPLLFGGDGQYNLGEVFTDTNMNGVRDVALGAQPAEAFTDLFGKSTFTQTFNVPLPCNYANEVFFRFRLAYGENETTTAVAVAENSEDNRNNNQDKGGALFGEVEDYRAVANDHCQQRVNIGYGARPFSNVLATTDGTILLATCGGTLPIPTQIWGDIWYNFNFPGAAAQEVTIDTCGSKFDTELAVYAGCGCPASQQTLVVCNNDSCGKQSKVTFMAQPGTCYKIRVGGSTYFDRGMGIIRITQGMQAQACGAGNPNDCFAASLTDSPGCNDAECCATVCDLDLFCCAVSWDGLCAAVANVGCTQPLLYFDETPYVVNESGGSATVTVKLSSAAGQTVTIDYATSDGDAQEGIDYFAASGTLQWNPGESGPRTFEVPILPDEEIELNETVVLMLLSPVNALLAGTNPETLTILDDDTVYYPVMYVDQDATGANNGSSWTDAFNRLEDALFAATQSETITQQLWVAEGTYVPGTDRSSTFQLVDGVAVYGGFAGFETSLDQRDPVANVTILSGDLADNDGSNFANNDENAYHVVTGSGVGPGAVLDGFTITGGNANGTDADESGGGLYASAGSPTLRNNLFTANRAFYGGGGLYAANGSAPLVVRCAFTMNNASGSISGNAGGGGIYCEYDSSATIVNCRVLQNTGICCGGGIFCRVNSSATIVNCDIAGNIAQYGAGLCFAISSNVLVADCTVRNNAASIVGGAVYVYAADPTMVNSIFWANTAPQGASFSLSNCPSNVSVSYCDVQGGQTGVHIINLPGCVLNWGAGNIEADPLLLPDGSLTAGSPCIDAGNDTLIPADLADLDADGDSVEPTPIDLAGGPRVLGGSVDMGALESSAPPAPVNDNCDTALTIADGDTPFSNQFATGDGFADCGSIGADIWYVYVAPCDGTVTVSTCGSGFDTVLVVYDYSDVPCPPELFLQVACNDNLCGQQSQVVFPAVTGQAFLIRIGGAGGAFGSGILTTTCTPNTHPACPSAGSCFAAHLGGGCDNAECCNLVCSDDPFCCNVQWDSMCADAAVASCVLPPPVSIATANPPRPADNPYQPGQPYRDVLDTGTTSLLTRGIGGVGTPNEGAIQFSPISVTFSGAPVPSPSTGNIVVSCTGGVCPVVTGVGGSGAGPYLITLDRPIPPGHCTTIQFAGSAAGAPLQYRSQPGNVSLNALTNTQDLLNLVQALNNGAAAQVGNRARYNVNRSTGATPVNTQDLLRLVQLLNGTLTTEPFNGDGVAACP